MMDFFVGGGSGWCCLELLVILHTLGLVLAELYNAPVSCLV